MNTSLEDTPFWFNYADEDWNQSKELRSKFRSIPDSEKDIVDNKTSIALNPLYHATIDEVVEDMMNQILRYMDII